MKTLLILIGAVAAFSFAGCGSIAKEGYAVDELADKAVADREAFMGKEVVVHGYVANISRDFKGKATGLSLDFDLYSATERQLSCTIADGQVPDDIRSKQITVKGKIPNIHSQNYMDLKSVVLYPCEMTKNVARN